MGALADCEDGAEEDQPDEGEARQFLGGGDAGIQQIAAGGVAEHQHHHEGQQQADGPFDDGLDMVDDALHCAASPCRRPSSCGRCELPVDLLQQFARLEGDRAASARAHRAAAAPALRTGCRSGSGHEVPFPVRHARGDERLVAGEEEVQQTRACGRQAGPGSGASRPSRRRPRPAPARSASAMWRAMAASHSWRSASVSGRPCAMRATFAGGCRSSPSRNAQPWRRGERRADAGLAAAGNAHDDDDRRH